MLLKEASGFKVLLNVSSRGYRNKKQGGTTRRCRGVCRALAPAVLGTAALGGTAKTSRERLLQQEGSSPHGLKGCYAVLGEGHLVHMSLTLSIPKGSFQVGSMPTVPQRQWARPNIAYRVQLYIAYRVQYAIHGVPAAVGKSLQPFTVSSVD